MHAAREAVALHAASHIHSVSQEAVPRALHANHAGICSSTVHTYATMLCLFLILLRWGVRLGEREGGGRHCVTHLSVFETYNGTMQGQLAWVYGHKEPCYCHQHRVCICEQMHWLSRAAEACRVNGTLRRPQQAASCTCCQHNPQPCMSGHTHKRSYGTAARHGTYGDAATEAQHIHAHTHWALLHIDAVSVY